MRERWFEAFHRDPHEAVSDLFTGRAGVGSDMRLDVPELLHLWFPKNMADDRCRLDEALLWWLGEMQRSYAATLERLGFAVYSKRVCDALIALQLLDLPQARNAIRRDLAAWLRWLSPLRLASARDPALECYGLLTQGQLDTSHMAMWLRLAADLRPEYLTVALAGLRRLPNEGDARQNQTLMLQALFRHAVVRFHDVDGARHFFNRRFAAVRGLFPRAPDHWNGILDRALHGFEHIEGPVAVDLAAQLRNRHTVNRLPASSRRSRRRFPAPDEVWQALEDHIVNSEQPTDELASRLFDILDQNHEYALAAGDSYNFVHTLSNLGSKLLEHHELVAADMARLGVMIERALIWAPANPYCWTLWAKWLKVQGRKEAEEAVLRETLRLFPRDAAAQVELARLLIERGEECWAEAKHYLHRTTGEDPDDGHAHVVTARLFALQGQRDDAEQMLVDFLARNSDNNDAREALDKLRTGAYRAQGDKLNDSGRQHAHSGDTLGMVAVPLQEVLRRGHLAGEFSRARIAGLANGHTERIEEESQRGDALAGFYSQWLKLPDTPECPPHAWSWKACLHWQQSSSADKWEELALLFPEAVSETRFLRTLAWPESSTTTNFRYPHVTDTAMRRPIDVAMHSWWPLAESGDLDQSQREEIACTVMACAAANAPEFVTATAGD